MVVRTSYLSISSMVYSSYFRLLGITDPEISPGGGGANTHGTEGASI